MASAFWTLEDGRGLARRWSGMAYMLKFITDELKYINEAKEFYNYLQEFVYREEKGDEYNGYGGFIREDEIIMFNFDLRSFAPNNREYFWDATQKALAKLKVENDKNKEGVINLFITLLSMHKSIKKGKNPMILNDMSIISLNPNQKLGPGWKK